MKLEDRKTSKTQPESFWDEESIIYLRWYIVELMRNMICTCQSLLENDHISHHNATFPYFSQFCGYVRPLFWGDMVFFKFTWDEDSPFVFVVGYVTVVPFVGGYNFVPIGGRRSCESFLSDGELVWWQVVTGAVWRRPVWGLVLLKDPVRRFRSGSLNGTHFGCIKLDANIWSIWRISPFSCALLGLVI